MISGRRLALAAVWLFASAHIAEAQVNDVQDFREVT